MTDLEPPDGPGRALGGWVQDTSAPPRPPDPAPRWVPEAAPAPPAPTAPTAPLAPAPAPAHRSPGPQRGPRRRPQVPGRILVVVGGLVVVALVAVLVVRSRGTTDADRVKDRIVAALAPAGLSDDDAHCVADHIVDALGTSELIKIDDFSATELPAGVEADFPERLGAAQTDAVTACHITVPTAGP